MDREFALQDWSTRLLRLVRLPFQDSLVLLSVLITHKFIQA